MKQILTLSVTAFQEKLYIAYMLFVLNLLDEFKVIGEMFEYYANQFRAAYDHLNFVYLKYDVKFFSEKMKNADKARTIAYRSLRARIRYLSMYAESAEVKDAALILLEIIVLYGEVTKMKMAEKSTVITNLIEDYEDKYAAQVTATGVGELLAALRTAQEEFMDAFMKRNEADSQYALNAMAEARKLMTEAYRDLVEVVNLAAKRDEDGVLTGFINRINNEIRRNFIYTGQRPASAGGGAADSEGEGDVMLKALNFKYINGTEVKLWFVVGEPVEAPANTEGYEWEPKVPEFMPKRGKTFKEVAIEAKKFTALFHFADHREEEIKQVAGSALTAPENTQGYVWDPTVPATMPAEDTTYYEIAEPEQQEPVTKTITYTHKGQVFTTQTYEVGAPISLPEAPSGYFWKNPPTKMPDHDITIVSTDDPYGIL